jgi:hypothetical protein
MNKTAKLVLFFLIAFVVNLLLMAFFILVLLKLASLVLGQNAPSIAGMIVMSFSFFVSIVLTFLVYGWLMKWATVKFNLEKHLPQLFKKKR